MAKEVPTKQNEPTELKEPPKVRMIKLTKSQAGAIKSGMDKINALAAEQARVEGMIRSAAEVQSGFVQSIIEDGGLSAEDFSSGYGIWEENGEKYLRPTDPPANQRKS